MKAEQEEQSMKIWSSNDDGKKLLKLQELTALTAGVVNKRSIWALVCMCVCSCLGMCMYVRRLWCWVKEVCFFPPCGASGWGRVRRSFGEAQHGVGCFSWTQCTVTALGAGGHRVQHSSRALSVYMTAVVPGGRWQLCITTPSDNSHCLYLCSSPTRETRILYSLFQVFRTVQTFNSFNPFTLTVHES